jgi:hypothetical protein
MLPLGIKGYLSLRLRCGPDVALKWQKQFYDPCITPDLRKKLTLTDLTRYVGYVSGCVVDPHSFQCGSGSRYLMTYNFTVKNLTFSQIFDIFIPYP